MNIMKHKIFLCTLLVFTYAFLFAQKAITRNPNFHTFLGVDVDNTSIRTNGLFINGVYKGYGAEKAGIQRGDSLMMINSTSLHNFNELVRVLDLYQPGDNIDLTIVRNHRPQKLSATVSAYPEFLKYNSL